ncbi:beta-1,3-glucan-binding protein-like [Cloeon dipterum]|uniref:beta-1,3-glucan-binding protein-like n=1 Tax=Cloeon dipterum TaxID=197152 RepID=UPI00321F7C0B
MLDPERVNLSQPVSGSKSDGRLAACSFSVKMKLLLVILASISIAESQFLTYEIPRPRITVFSPRALRFLLPHEDGITRAVLLANVNKPLSISDTTASLTKELRQARSNRLWVFFFPHEVLKEGDIINYKLAVEHKGKLHFSGPHSFRVNVITPLPNQAAQEVPENITWPGVELSAGGSSPVPPPRPAAPVAPAATPRPPPPKPPAAATTKRPPAAAQQCRPSSTVVNGKPACKGQLLFQDHFDSLDTRKWKHSVYIADAPDFEFCMYTNRKENAYVREGVLHIRPTLTESTFGANFITSGNITLDQCTATVRDECSHQANFGFIMPPVQSARLASVPHFTFKFGRVEVRAKMALGDWLLSGIYLEPLRRTYGPRYDSGQVRMGVSKGNIRLECDDVESGISLVESGIVLTASEDYMLRQLSSRELPNGQAWDQNFHVFRADWSPDKIVIQIDGNVINTIFPPPGGFGTLEEFSESPTNPWRAGSKFAPFDQEFYIAFGVGVGGIHDFPDNCLNNGERKPWTNGQPKAKLNFWKQQNKWYPTWDLQDGSMQIDYVKVYAL